MSKILTFPQDLSNMTEVPCIVSLYFTFLIYMNWCSMVLALRVNSLLCRPALGSTFSELQYLSSSWPSIITNSQIQKIIWIINNQKTILKENGNGLNYQKNWYTYVGTYVDKKYLPVLYLNLVPFGIWYLSFDRKEELIFEI